MERLPLRTLLLFLAIALRFPSLSCADPIDIVDGGRFFKKPRPFTRSQPTFSDPVPIDAGWSYGTGQKLSHEIVFRAAEKVGYRFGTDLTVRLIQVYQNDQAQLGRFRISVTTQTKINPEAEKPRDVFPKGNWIPLAPSRVEINKEGVSAEIKDDHSILIKGKNGNCTVTVAARTMVTGITGFRVEALLDPSLPNEGPGRKASGGFTVSQFEFNAWPAVTPELQAAVLTASSRKAPALTVPLRRRSLVRSDDFAQAEWAKTEKLFTFNPKETAIVIIDLGNFTFCKTEEPRLTRMVSRLNVFLDAARKMGITVVHSASGTMPYYENSPQRKRVTSVKAASLPKPPERIMIRELPWMDNGRCDCLNGPCDLWRSTATATAVRPDIKVLADDAIADPDNAAELYGFCKSRGIKNLLFCGSASNMCIQWRRGALQVMAAYGFNAILVRDATLATSGNGYDGALDKPAPSLTPERGDDIVIEEFERFIGPTVSVWDFVKLLRAWE